MPFILPDFLLNSAYFCSEVNKAIEEKERREIRKLRKKMEFKAKPIRFLSMRHHSGRKSHLKRKKMKSQAKAMEVLRATDFPKNEDKDPETKLLSIKKT